MAVRQPVKATDRKALLKVNSVGVPKPNKLARAHGTAGNQSPLGTPPNKSGAVFGKSSAIGSSMGKRTLIKHPKMQHIGARESK